MTSTRGVKLCSSRDGFVFTYFFALCLYYSVMSCWAKESDKKSFELGEIVFTATKTEKTTADVPAAVSVITKADIEKKNHININEVLETIPGVMSYSGTGIAPGPPASPVVNLRGFHGATRTMIMVNNQPISPFLYAASLVHWTAIPADVVERIEVVRGPFSALYGGDAVGGVINIITKTPEKFEATAKSGIGSHSTYKEHASMGGKPIDKLSLFAAYDYKKTDNYVSAYTIRRAAQPTPGEAAGATPVTGPVRQPYKRGGSAFEIGNEGEYDYSEHTFTVNLKLDPSDSSSLRANILYSLYEIEPFGSSSYLRDASGNEVRSGWVSFPEDGESTYLSITSGGFLASRAEKATGIYTLNYTNDISDRFRFKLSGGLTDFNTDKIIWPGANATETDGEGTFQEAPSKIWTGELQTDFEITEHLLLTSGLSYRRDEGDYRSYASTNWRDFDSLNGLIQAIDPESNRYGAYVQAEWRAVRSLAVYLGLRYDWWDSKATRRTPDVTDNLSAHDKDAVSPKVSLVYSPWVNTRVRLSGGKAFRVPNFFELYQPLRASGTTYVPNPDLDPEITWGWEGGVEHAFFSGWSVLCLTYFEHYTEDFIDSRTYPDPEAQDTIIAQRDNFGEVEVKGIEIELKQKISDYANGFANYTYIDAEITDNPNYPQYVGHRPRYVPDHMFNAGIRVDYQRIAATVTTHYRSKMYAKNANSTVNWEVYGVQDEIPFVTDITLGYDLSKHFTFSFSVSDLFDEEYFLCNRAPGRTFFGMLTAKF